MAFVTFTTLYFLSLLPFIYSLSTVAISETSNQTFVCALLHSSEQQQSSLSCIGFPRGIRVPLNSPNTSFSGIVGGKGFLCALRTSFSFSLIVCWRVLDSGISVTYKRIYLGPSLNELDAGNSHICGIVNGTNRIECWKYRGFRSPMNQFFSSIAVGENFICGLLEFGRVQCLGSYNGVTDYLPSGNYSVVAAGFRHACAISLNGSLECWGQQTGMNEEPEGQFTSLALGENRSCGLRSNGTVVCWGENNFRLPETLQGIFFTAIEAARGVFCGVATEDYSLYCWGDESLYSNSRIFSNVVPGPCRTECPCGPLPNYGRYCSQGLLICDLCLREPSPAVEPSPQPPWSASPPPPCGPWSRKMVVFLAVGCIGTLSFLAVCCFLFFHFGKITGSRIHDSGSLDQTGTLPKQGDRTSRASVVLEKKLSHLISMENGYCLEEFSLPALIKATNNFSEDHKIGSGSFGSVYRATLYDGGERREVAIKRAEISAPSTYPGCTNLHEDNNDAFMNELEFLSRLHHKNLVRLFGFCQDSNELLLVYECMDNGTLHDHLFKLQSSPLMSWALRIKLALDAARGIEYLHEYAVPAIIHRDIKSSNILLDATWTAKVSDFGLSLRGPQEGESHLSLRAAGTVGYMDPEYFRLEQLTTKSDVYSFGVVMLELLSGYKAIHKNENEVPRNVVDFVVPYIVQDEIHRILDPRVPPPTLFEIEAVAYVGYLAADCVKLEGRDRPSMTEIVSSLDTALAGCLATPMLSQSTTTGSSSSMIEIVNSLGTALEGC